MNSAVAYIDVIGYSDSVLQGTEPQSDENNAIRVLKKFHQSIKDAIVLATKIRPFPVEPHVQVISDSCFITFIDNQVGISAVDQFENACSFILCLAQIVSIIQIECGSAGFFIRGGISCGVVYKDQDILTGLPVARSVKLESEVADACCVVLCMNSELALRHHFHNVWGSEKSQKYKPDVLDRKKLFLFREDGQLIVNPFSVLDIYSIAEESSELGQRFSSFYASLQVQLYKFELNRKLYKKYSLIRSMLNYSILDKNIAIPTNCFMAIPSSDTPDLLRSFDDQLNLNVQKQ